MTEYIKKEDVLEILYDIKENKDIPKNYGTLLAIIRLVRNLSPEKVISENMGKCELAIAQNNNLHTDCNYCIELAKIEAVEEFAETLKEKSKYAKQIPAGEYFEAVDVEDVNNLVKERKGEE